MIKSDQLNPLNSTKLISLDFYFNEMIELYDSKVFPKVILLNGKKGIGKFTLVIHFLNYIFSKNERTSYNINDKVINIDSIFYNSLLNQTVQNVLFIKAEENKNIKIEDIRNLKYTLSRSSLSNNPRFTIIDEVEFLNTSSVNALLKTLEEPTNNNYFILVNNQQTDLIKTLSSRCLKTNIFLTTKQSLAVIDYLKQNKYVENLIAVDDNLTPGLFVKFNELFSKYNIDKKDNIFIKLSKLLNNYKKDKNKFIINLAFFFIDHFFYQLVSENEKKIDFLLDVKSSIIKSINDFIQYNLNTSSVLNSIEVKLNNV